MPSTETNGTRTGFLLKPVANGRTTTLTYQHFRVELHPDDARDKVFLAIVKALLRQSNRPCTPKELSNLILKHKLTTLGGATPYATVSSRISQHYKRATELNRSPLLGRRSLNEKNSRRLVYFVDQAGVPVNPGEDRGSSDSEDGMDGNTAGSTRNAFSGGSSPLLSPTNSLLPSRNSASGAEENHLFESERHSHRTPVAPLRVSTRVKRRRSPYSPPNEPQAFMKRSRSASISGHSLPTSPAVSEDEDDSATLDRQSARSHSALARSVSPENITPGQDQGELPSTPSSPMFASSSSPTIHEAASNDDIEPQGMDVEEGPQDFSEDMLEVTAVFSAENPRDADVHTEFTGTRQRTTSDDFVLHPITAPHVSSLSTNTPPSKVYMSLPAVLGFESPNLLPPPLFGSALGVLGELDVEYTSPHKDNAPTEVYRGNVTAKSLFENNEFSLYHGFHHPENVSVSELDFLLGEGANLNGGWGSGFMDTSRKRVVDSQMATGKSAKRRRVETGCRDGVPESKTWTDDDSDDARDARDRSAARPPSQPLRQQADSNTSTAETGQRTGTALPCTKQSATNPEELASMSIPFEQQIIPPYAPSPPASPPTKRDRRVSIAPYAGPGSLAVASYRCNGDTLEVHEKVEHHPVPIHVSKITSAPSFELNIRTLPVDPSGRASSTTNSAEGANGQKVSFRLEGFVRAQGLLDAGLKVWSAPVEALDTTDLLVVKAENGAKADREQSEAFVWNAFLEEVRSRTAAPRTVDESVAVRIHLRNNDSVGHTFVVLKVSDAEGDSGVPVQCGGVWIPTQEARKLANHLGIMDRLDDFLTMHPEASASGASASGPLSREHLNSGPPPGATLSVPATPNRSSLCLPSPAQTPHLAVEVKMAPAARSISSVSETVPAAAITIEEEIAHEDEDFLVFEQPGLTGDWSHDGDGDGNHSGDDPAGDSQAVGKPATQQGVAHAVSHAPPVTLDPAKLNLVSPVEPVAGSVPIYMTDVDGILCYVLWLLKGADGQYTATPAEAMRHEQSSTIPPSSNESTATPQASTSDPNKTENVPVPVLRRVDNNMVNATLLLHAGGMVTDRERSIVLSLERGRARCRKKGSGLYGTWIPLARARHLARTFCLQQKLGGFLSNSVTKSSFGVVEPEVVFEDITVGGVGMRMDDGVAVDKMEVLTAGPTTMVNPLAWKDTQGRGAVASATSTVGKATANARSKQSSAPTASRPSARSHPAAVSTALPVTSGPNAVSSSGAKAAVPSSATSSLLRPPFTAATTASPLHTHGVSTTSAPSTTTLTPSPATIAATQAAIAALTKLGGSGPLTAATLANALAALNQLNAHNNKYAARPLTNTVGTGAAPSLGAPAHTNGTVNSPLNQAPTGTSAASALATVAPASIPSPASILEAFTNVFKSGFASGWTPTSAGTPSSSIGTKPSAASNPVTSALRPSVGTTFSGPLGSPLPTSFAASLTSRLASSPYKLPSSSLSATTTTGLAQSSLKPSTAFASPLRGSTVTPMPVVSSAKPVPTTGSTSVAGHSHGAVSNNLMLTSISSNAKMAAPAAMPTSETAMKQTAVTASAIANRSTGFAAPNPVSMQINALAGLPLLASSGVSTASLASTYPFLPVSSSLLGSATVHTPLPTSTATSVCPAMNNASLPTTALPTLATSTSPGLGSVLPMLTQPSVPLIALDDIDGGDGKLPIASSAALAAVAAAAGFPLHVGQSHVQEFAKQNTVGIGKPSTTEGLAMSNMATVEDFTDDGSQDETAEDEAEGADHGATSYATSYDDTDDLDQEDDFDHLNAMAGGQRFPSSHPPAVGGGKIKPQKPIPVPAQAVSQPKRGSKARGVAGAVDGKASRKATTAAVARKPAAKKQKQSHGTGTIAVAKAIARKKRGARVPTSTPSTSIPTSTPVIVRLAEEEGEETDIEIDVVDGDGVDDFR